MAGSELLGLTGKGPTVFEELQKKQVLLAASLEIQFWDLTDFPHTSKHVRLAAHGARTIHGDTVMLFQRFSVTVKHIVHTLMPMLLEGIGLDEESLVAGAFNEVLSCVTEMATGTDDLYSRYVNLSSEIGNSKENVDEAEVARLTENTSRIKQLDEEIEKANKEVRALKRTWDEHEQTLTRLSQDVKKIKIRNNGSSTTLFPLLEDESLTPLFHLLGRLWNSTSEAEKSRLNEKFDKTKEQMLDILPKNEEWTSRIKDLAKQKERKEAEKPINSEGILKAKYVLQAIIRHVSDICTFWKTMIKNIQPLAHEQGASEVYRSTRESESVRKIFMEKMMLSQKSWERLDGLCMEYVRHFHEDPVESLVQIFAFLSAPTGQTREVIEARTSDLRNIVTPWA